jgi:hypothetical protein
MKDETYNGWTNYATWRVNLELVDGYDWDGSKFENVSELADTIQENVHQAVMQYGDIDESSLVASYAYAFLQDVNYYEIARNYADAYPEIIATV